MMRRARLPQRTLGRQGLRVSTTGLGTMRMSEFDGAGNDAESIATIHGALAVHLTREDLAQFDESTHGVTADECYPAVQMQALNR